MKSSEILKKVKTILNPDDFGPESPYICDCVSKVCRKIDVYGQDNLDKGYEIKEFIKRLIEHEFSLEQWIKNRGYMSNEEMEELRKWNHGYAREGRPQAVIKLYNTRQAFLDWMIEQYEAKGD